MPLPKDFARRFHAAQAKVEKAERERDALVVEARKTTSLREIAKALGVSHTMVAKIERRADAFDSIEEDRREFERRMP